MKWEFYEFYPFLLGIMIQNRETCQPTSTSSKPNRELSRVSKWRTIHDDLIEHDQKHNLVSSLWEFCSIIFGPPLETAGNRKRTDCGFALAVKALPVFFGQAATTLKAWASKKDLGDVGETDRWVLSFHLVPWDGNMA